MTIVFASNSPVDFNANGPVDTTAERFRATHVSHAHISAGNEDEITESIRVDHPEVAGTSTWIHVKGWSSHTMGGNNAIGVFWFRCFDSIGRTLFYFATDGSSGVRLRVAGDTTVSHSIGQIPPWAVTTLQDIDIHVDLSGGNIKVDVYMDKSMSTTFSATAANTGGKGNPVTEYWAARDWQNVDRDVTQAVSEYIVADVDTRGMGLTDLFTIGSGNYAEWTGDVADISDGSVESGLTVDVIDKKVTRNVSAYGGPTGVVLGVFLGVYGSVSGAVGDLRAVARKGTTDFFSADAGVNSVRPRPNLMEFLDNPDTASAWATTEFVDFEFGVESVA